VQQAGSSPKPGIVNGIDSKSRHRFMLCVEWQNLAEQGILDVTRLNPAEKTLWNTQWKPLRSRSCRRPQMIGKAELIDQIVGVPDCICERTLPGRSPVAGLTGW